MERVAGIPTDITILERIQKKAANVVKDGVGHMFEKVELLGLDSLVTRRRNVRLCTLFKMYSGHKAWGI